MKKAKLPKDKLKNKYETVRSLSVPDLGPVQGGKLADNPTWSCPPRCESQ